MRDFAPDPYQISKYLTRISPRLFHHRSVGTVPLKMIFFIQIYGKKIWTVLKPKFAFASFCVLSLFACLLIKPTAFIFLYEIYYSFSILGPELSRWTLFRGFSEQGNGTMKELHRLGRQGLKGLPHEMKNFVEVLKRWAQSFLMLV